MNKVYSKGYSSDHLLQISKICILEIGGKEDEIEDGRGESQDQNTKKLPTTYISVSVT